VAGTPSGVRIVHAREDSLAAINALIARSKAYWNWPAEYLEQALPLHTVTPAYLRANRCFEVLDAREHLVAFYALVESDARMVLDNLWVIPELIGQGIGRWVCAHALRLAREAGRGELWVLPEPPAEGFYRRLGFSDTGERQPSRVPGGPLYSIYRIGL
jgi:GNAT superfamily N-acetyltransferase